MTTLDRMHDRLRWRCRRGMLELDLVLERFNERHLPTLSAAERKSLEALLEYSDNHLWDIVCGRLEADVPDSANLVRRLRES